MGHLPRRLSHTCLLAPVLLVACAQAPYDPHPVPDPEPLPGEAEDLQPATGEEALDWLLAGNHRFWDGHPRESHESIRRSALLSDAQHPFAIVLGCADSRVPPELVFDHGLGDLFVIRVAGNVVAENEAASIEYAVDHLRTPLVLVLGHEGCGAVTAALSAHDDEPAELRGLLERIFSHLGDIPADLPLDERLRRGVEVNVRYSVEQLRAITGGVGPHGEPPPLIVGAVYELESGMVRVLED